MRQETRDRRGEKGYVRQVTGDRTCETGDSRHDTRDRRQEICTFSKKVLGENFWKNTAQLRNFFMARIFPLKCGAVAHRFKKWRTSRWCKLKKVACAQHWRLVS